MKVNEDLLEKGLPTVSYSAVRKFLSNPIVRNQCDTLRYGEGYAKQNLLPHLVRKEPKYMGEALQVDATTLNMNCLDESNNIIRLTLCVVMDVYSRKVVGYSFAKFENSTMILDALQMAFSKFRIIPKQILWDNHKAYYSYEFQVFQDFMEEYGVNIRSSRIGNARDKAQIERFFRTFQTKYMQVVFGNFGDGIKAKKLGNKVHPELERLYNQKKNIRDIKSFKNLIISLLDAYNSDVELERKIKKGNRSKKFSPQDIAKIFYKSTIIRVRRSMVKIRCNKNSYQYTVRNDYLAERINNTRVVVRYNENDLSKIFLFEDITGFYLGELTIDYQINIIATQHDRKVIKAQNELIKNRIKNQVFKLIEDFEKGKIELKSLPTQLHNSKSSLQKTLEQAEDELMIVDMLPSKEKYPERKKSKDSEAAFKNVSDMYFRKSHKTRIIKSTE